MAVLTFSRLSEWQRPHHKAVQPARISCMLYGIVPDLFFTLYLVFTPNLTKYNVPVLLNDVPARGSYPFRDLASDIILTIRSISWPEIVTITIRELRDFSLLFQFLHTLIFYRRTFQQH